MPRPSSLSLATPTTNISTISSTVTSPSDVESGVSSPRSANAHQFPPSASTRHHKPTKSEPLTTSEPQSPEIQPASPEITSLPAFPPSPLEAPKRSKQETAKGFFSNLKASRSSNKVQNSESTIRHIPPESHRGRGEPPQPQSLYSLRKGPESTPDLSLSNLQIDSQSDVPGRSRARDESRGSNNSSDQHPGAPRQQQRIPRRPLPTAISSDTSITSSPTDPGFPRKPRPRFSNLIGRTRSIRVDEAPTRRGKTTTPRSAVSPARGKQFESVGEEEVSAGTPMTAPLHPDRSLKDLMNSSMRGRSADRQSANNQSTENVSVRRAGLASSGSNTTTTVVSGPPPVVGRDGAGSQLFANLKDRSTRAADGLGKASKGFLSKMNHRGSETRERDERYVLKNINLPLVEQTRKTRIAARLEDSKDKTEFWMPALPWRCIDYLNYRGCEEEGLYRVPGSDVQVRHWQKRFDIEGDINLFNEPELYDINIIGSMFKAWLRELPTEIFPKATQAKVAKECPDATEVPQVLKDELSMLPPWNYYLLFAITCHLSLLTAYSDKNKMTYNNLCICFQPALKMDAFCFHFLVQHWRECWQGCYTEKEALEDEYRVLDGLASSSGESSTGSAAVHIDDSHQQLQHQRVPPTIPPAPPSSSSSNKTPNTITGAKAPTVAGASNRPPALNLSRAGNEPPPSTPAPCSVTKPNGHVGVDENDSTTLEVSQAPEIAPVKPLSPLMGEYKAT